MESGEPWHVGLMVYCQLFEAVERRSVAMKTATDESASNQPSNHLDDNKMPARLTS